MLMVRDKKERRKRKLDSTRRIKCTLRLILGDIERAHLSLSFRIACSSCLVFYLIVIVYTYVCTCVITNIRILRRVLDTFFRLLNVVIGRLFGIFDIFFTSYVLYN